VNRELPAGRPPICIDGSSFVIAANGFSEGPSQPLHRFLLENGAKTVTTITHPLLKDGSNEHWVTTESVGTTTKRVRKLPNRPPLTYAFDPFVPFRPPRANVWFGFNCIATAQGIVHRSIKRIDRVVHWNVDFVPDRFGSNPITMLYDRLDAFCCTHADGRVELSEAALAGRIERYALQPTIPAEVIPMGAWIADTPQTAASNLESRRVVFLGSLVERMGIDVLIDAVILLRSAGTPVVLDVVGGGELLDRLQRRVADEGLADVVELHGFIPDFDGVMRILASASVAVAPYDPDPSSFTHFADPGKLKAYLSAGLPILLTDVPPNADDLAREGGAEIVPFDSVLIAERIDALLGDPNEWAARHRSAQRYTKQFDWATLFTERLGRLGLSA